MESESAAGQGRGNGEIAVYQEEGGRVRLEVRLEVDTVAESATVRREGDWEVARQVGYYNLDAIPRSSRER